VAGGLFSIPSNDEQGTVGGLFSVFCFKGRIDAKRLEHLRSAGAITVDMGDYILIWIDSFGSNTMQGGYETVVCGRGKSS
jgi:hypothetical protein